MLRWRGLLLSLGRRVPVRTSIVLYVSGFALSMSPAKAGEAIRTVYLSRLGFDSRPGISVFIAERMLDLVVVGLVTAIWVLPSAALLVVLLGLTGLVQLAHWRRPLDAIAKLSRRFHVLRHVRDSATQVQLMITGRRLLWAGPLTLLAWLIQGSELVIIVHAQRG